MGSSSWENGFRCQIDGIKAKGLDEELELVVDEYHE